MKKKKKTYGTSKGVELTDELLDKLVAKAEAGYEPSEIRPRPGRPPMGSAAAFVFQVRLEPELRDAVRKCAKDQGISPSELVRRILRRDLLAP